MPPDGAPFYAKIVRGDDGAPLAVVSNRGGRWAPETLLTVADLVVPEQPSWTSRQIDRSRSAAIFDQRS